MSVVEIQNNITDEYFDYVLATVFNLNNLTDYELTQATFELAPVIKHSKFLEFVKAELAQNNIFGSTYQKFLIIVQRFKKMYFEDLKANEPKSKNELFAEQFEKKVLMIVKGLRATRDRVSMLKAQREKIDVDELTLAGMPKESIDVMIGIAKSYAHQEFQDSSKEVRGLLKALDDNLLEKMIEDRFDVLIAGCMRQIERTKSFFADDVDRAVAYQQEKIEKYEELKKHLLKSVEKICDVYERRLQIDYDSEKRIEKYLVERDGEKVPLFNQSELRFFYGIGFDQIISYVDQGYLKRAVLDAFKKKQSENVGQIGGASRVQGLIGVRRF